MRAPQSATSFEVELYHWHDVEVEVPSASGNLYDVIADVEWTHQDGVTIRRGKAFYTGAGSTFAFRFGAEKMGTWTGITRSSVAGLDGLTLEATVTTLRNNARAGYHVYDRANPTHWLQQRGSTGSVVRTAPRLVMWDGPEQFYNNMTRLQRHVDTFADDHGFTGAHVYSLGRRMFDLESTSGFHGRAFTGTETNPDPRTFAALEELIDRWLDEGGQVHIWLYTDAARGGSLDDLPGGYNGTVANRLHRYITARLGPVPGWSMGIGFDLREWLSTTEFSDWLDQFPFDDDTSWHHWIGGRYQSGSYTDEAIAWNTLDSHQLQYASWEHHWPSYTDRNQSDSRIISDLMAYCEEGKAAVPVRPHFSEDRFRHRDEGRTKDFRSDDEILPVLEAYGRAGWAAIYGYYMDGSSDVITSQPWPNAADVKAVNDAVDAALR